MLVKKEVTFSRESGELISEKIIGESDMSEAAYYKPFIDLYKAGVEKLIADMEDKKFIAEGTNV